MTPLDGVLLAIGGLCTFLVVGYAVGMLWGALLNAWDRWRDKREA